MKNIIQKTVIYLLGIFAVAWWTEAALGQSSERESAAPVRVACIGDSITVSPKPGQDYPAQLQIMLGTNWDVGNFGVSGRTLLRNGDFPYWRESAFTNAQKFQPDMVIILLGANDSKPYNWKYHDEFARDYADLVNVFRNLASHPRIYVCRLTPVPEPGNYGINEATEQEETKTIDDLVDTMHLNEIDLYAPLKNQPQLFPDRVHPNAEGAVAMAKVVEQALTSPEKTPSSQMVIPLLPGEKIWSGVIKDGENLPYVAGSHYDFYANNRENQIQPLLLGSQGLWVWSDDPYAFEVAADKIIITNAKGEVKSGRAGNSLAEARRFASAQFFPPSGAMPDELLFARPQYNTWIELNLHQNQSDVLKYAHAIIANGFSPGVLMIDDTWQEDYGVWNFHPGKFPNPKQMMKELHRMGFKVMLWICPFVSADQSQLVHQFLKDKCFLMQKSDAQTTWATATDPAIIKWWNGYSALLDFSNPKAVHWFNDQMDRLVKNYGVDGFKLDAGDMNFYPPNALSAGSVLPNRQCELYAQFGLRFPLNEYRACWKMAGQPLAQRLHDKNHSWEDVQKLIPQMLTEGLVGYTFSCPDMIGGGMLGSFADLKEINQDLVVRSAQIHALMPMMQFSVAPWRVLDAEHLIAVKKAAAVREKFTQKILNLARNSAKTGDPIIRPLEYEFPNQGYEDVKDEFMLGDSILVAPQDKKGTSRQVVLPKGEWIGDDGKTLNGRATYTLEVPLERIPYFRLKKS